MSATGSRESEPFRYPRYDLENSIKVAAAIHEQGGGAASMPQLASFLGYGSTRNGAFQQRVGATKMFGLADGRGTLVLTSLARDILQPEYEATSARARLLAFENVPLFRAVLEEYEGRNLPSQAGMLNALETKFGVNPRRVKLALARLLDSAEQAGLFRVAGSRSRMVRPPLGAFENPPNVLIETAPAGEEPATPANGRYPRVIEAALDELPQPSEKWTEADLREWLDWFEGALRIHFRLPRHRKALPEGQK